MRQSEDQHFGYILHQIAHLVMLLHNEKLEKEGVTASQARVLTLLYTHDGATQSQLQHDLLIRPSSVTKLVDALEYKGLVRRGSSEKDGRLKIIHLTESGKHLEERLWSIKDELEAQITKGLSNQQQAELINLLYLVKKELM